MKYTITRPFYGPPVAHLSSCWTLKDVTNGDPSERIPPGAVLCSMCHPVGERDPDPDLVESEDGFIIVRDPHRPRSPIAHHPLCRTLTTRHSGGSRYNHRRVPSVPDGVRICHLCHCQPPRRRIVGPGGKRRRISQAKPVGDYVVLERPNGRGPRYAPVCCPSCSAKSIERVEKSRLWYCLSCSWEGQVITKTWTRVERESPRSTQGGSGAASIRGEISNQIRRGVVFG